MGSCGWSRRRVAPEGRADGAKQQPPLRARVNGWSPPLHYFQAVAWAVLLTMAIAAFGVVIPLLPGVWKLVAYGLTGGLFLTHLVVHVLTVSIDPAEPNVRNKKSYPEPVPLLDRAKHAHVIQNQYCHLCAVTVSPTAKHCSACNKCISGFDHHCKWLNNCVGSRNYWCFFGSVASAVATLLCILVANLYISVQYFVNPQELRTDPRFEQVADPGTWLLLLPVWAVRVSGPVLLGLEAAVLLLDATCLVLLGQLLLFHLHLVFKNMSTFEYMRRGQWEEGTTASRGKAPPPKVEEDFPQHEDESWSSSDQSREKLEGLLAPRQHPSLCSTNSVHPESSSLQMAGELRQEPGSRGGSGDGHDGEATGGELPLPADCSMLQGHFALANLPRGSALEIGLHPNFLNTGSHAQAAHKLWGSILGGQMSQSLGPNANANSQPEQEQGFQEVCGQQQDWLPESQEDEAAHGDVAESGIMAESGDVGVDGAVAVDGDAALVWDKNSVEDLRSSQAATGPPAAQGEVRVDLSPLLSQEDSSPTSETLGPGADTPVPSVVILMYDDVGI